MSKKLTVLAVTLIVAAALALWLPKKIWIHHMQQRLEFIKQQEASCGKADSCRERVSFELNLFMHDVENPPWYVVNAGQGDGPPIW